MAARAIEHGEADIAVAVGFDKHPRGAFSADPSVLGLPAWYAETGMFLTTHFFGMKINRYMHEYGITLMTLARVAAKNFRNGELNERAWRRTPMSEEDILAAPYLNYPLTRFMYCAPDEGRRRWCCAVPTRPANTRANLSGLRRRCCVPAPTGRSRCSARRCLPPGHRALPSPHRSRRTSWPGIAIGCGGGAVAGHRRRLRGHPHGGERILRRR